MLLLLDAGNSRLKWGLHDGGDWRARGALEHGELPRLTAEIAPHGRPARALGSNVAGAAVARAVEAALASFACPLGWITAQPQQCGVRNGYRNPGQLGVDRWAALIGARHLHRGPAVVVMAGTATTVDVLTAEGVFAGGLILPGFELMRAALARGTAGLPLAQASLAALPRDTDEAIVAGCLLAQAGAVRRMFAHVEGDPAALCLLSGGGAALLQPALDVPLRTVDNLVLEGLLRIALEDAAS